MGGLIAVMLGLLIQEHWKPLGRGSLVVISTPPGGTIWLDLKPTDRVTDGRLEHVRPGRHSVAVRTPMMQSDPVAQVVDVHAGRTDTVFFRLQPLGTVPPAPEVTDTGTDTPLPLPPLGDVADDTAQAYVPTGDELRRNAEQAESLLTRPALLPLPHNEPRTSQATTEARAKTQAGTGGVEIRTSEPGAQVFVDGVLQDGLTPLRLALNPGPHIVHVEREGFEPDRAVDSINVRAGGASQSIFFNLLPRPS